MLRKIRTVTAVVFFVGVTLLFLDFSGTLAAWLGWMAKVQFLPAVLSLNVAVVVGLIILTLIFGRIYCSVICPLGILQDVEWRIANMFHKKNRTTFSKERKWLRYGMLAIFILLLLMGFTGIAALVAPYSSYGRMAQNLLQPVWLLGNNLLAMAAEHFESYAFYNKEVWLRSLPTFVVAVVSFVAIAVLAWRGGRTYCNTICPVGTVLSFFSRFSWFRIYFDSEKCRSCSLCTKNCKASCIDYKHHYVDHSRCVACGDCLSKCSFGALHYGHPKKGKTAEPAGDNMENEGRRHFLLGAALATTAAATAQKQKKVDGGMATIVDKQAPDRHTPITPPGSLSAQNMSQHCTACQLCVAECPNDVLRPSTDLDHFMQPEMSYERGYCRPECNRCSQVCPAGAIKPITKAEKTAVHMGHAVWIKKNCVVVTDGVECGNCARHCPANAIEMVPIDPNDDLSPKIPAVNEARCIGCGACENLCPSRPFSAIYVEGHEVHRMD